MKNNLVHYGVKLERAQNYRARHRPDSYLKDVYLLPLGSRSTALINQLEDRDSDANIRRI
jgi:hypothetical protein